MTMARAIAHRRTWNFTGNIDIVMSFLQLLLTLLLPFFGNVHSFVPSYAGLSLPTTTAASLRGASPALSDTSLSLSSPAVVDTDTSSSSNNNDDDAPHTPQLGAWIPLGSASSLTGINPVQIRVCGLDIAVWHKPLPPKSKKGAVATEWSAMIDACPHRLAPLSQGRVDTDSGCLECPYHGWSFDADGSLGSLPQLDEEGRGADAKARVSRNGGSATSLPVHAAGDLLFVFLPADVTGESWPISRLPKHHYPHLQDKIDKGTTYYSRDLPYSLDFLLENFMDPAHIPYAHHSLQGTRDDGSPIEMKALANNFTHVEASFVDVCLGKQRDGVASFQRPAFYHFRTRPNATAAYQPNLLIFTAPIDEGRCRIMMPDFVNSRWFPTWLGHLGSNRFLNSDTWLHDAERTARISTNAVNEQRGSLAVGAAKAGRNPVDRLNYVLATKSDLGPSLFRNWWTKHGFAKAPPNTFGPASASSLQMRSALSRAEQIDPWMHHSKNCAKCRRALRSMRVLQRASTAFAAIGAIVLRRKPPISIGIVLVGL